MTSVNVVILVINKVSTFFLAVRAGRSSVGHCWQVLGSQVPRSRTRLLHDTFMLRWTQSGLCG